MPGLDILAGGENRPSRPMYLPLAAAAARALGVRGGGAGKVKDMAVIGGLIGGGMFFLEFSFDRVRVEEVLGGMMLEAL